MSTLNGIGDTTLGDILSKRLVTPGGAVAPGVAPELFPNITLENDRPEWLFLSGQGLYSYYTAQAAGGAGTRSSVALYNTSPDTLVVVEHVYIEVASNVPQMFMIAQPEGTIPFGTQERGVSADSRARQAGATQVRRSSAFFVRDNTLAAAGGANNRLWQGTGLTLTLTTPFVLGPWCALYCAPGTDNVAINVVAMRWRERRMAQSERL